MRLLKALVIGMGVLIIAGVVAVGYGLYRQGTGGAKQTATVPTTVPGEVTSFADREIALSPGERIIDLAYPDGRMAVRTGATDGSERIIFFDLTTGQHLGSIRLKTTP